MVLAWLAAAWLAGIAAAATFGRGAWPLALALAAAMLTLALVRRDRRTAIYAVALPAIFAVALLRFDTARPETPHDAVANYNDGVAMRVRGVVRGEPDIRDTVQRFSVNVRQVQRRGAWEPASGAVQVTSPLYPRYRSGDVVELEGPLESPHSIGSFDYGAYLARKGIASEMSFPRVRSVGHEQAGIGRATIRRVRRELSGALARTLPEPQSSLAQGVLLGQRSALPVVVAADLNATNTSHLVVVSGSNVVLVAGFATLLFAWFAGKRRAMLLSIAAVVAYAALVGASPPVLRATIMGILLIVARLNGRPASGLTSVMFAAMIMTGAHPAIVRDVSFQLSFAATAGIVLLQPAIHDWCVEFSGRILHRDAVPRLLNELLLEPLAMTVAASLATTPLIALTFGRISLVGLPANVLVVPAFPLILLASLLAAIGGLLPFLHVVLAAPAYYLLSYWLGAAGALASLPHSSPAGTYSAPWAVVTYAAIAAAVWSLHTTFGRPFGAHVAPSRPVRLSRLNALAAVGVPAAVAVVTAGWAFWPSPPARLQVTVLDVGQGDAILIRTPSGHDILVDGGPGRAVVRGLGDQLPWHDRSIEMVVLTHPQSDHMYGLIDVLDRYDVRRVFAGPGVQPSPGADAWEQAVAAEGRTIEIVRAGMMLDLGDGVRLEVLAPDPVEAVDPRINNTGAVIKVTWGDVSFLLTADIEARAEAALLASGADLRATVLKVPHHGSATSSTAAFLQAVQPSASVVSSGADNQFGHPVASVVGRLDAYGPVYNTASSGHVRFETDGHRLWISTAR